MRAIRALAIATLLAGALLSAAKADDRACTNPDVTITAEALSDDDIQLFEKTLRTAIAKVCNWWGPTFAGPYRVTIKDDKGPSMAMIPAWRGHHGNMLFRSEKTRERASPVVHEVTHIFAPNANRFVAEGLAVYAQEHLGGQRAYPNFGRDLHKAAKPYADWADLPMLDAIVVPKGLLTPDRPQQLKAYTVAGSFVRYLIETRGMATFRALYALTPMVPHERIPSDPARWEAIYGKPLPALAAEWKDFLARQ
jgi:hypothetical protein